MARLGPHALALLGAMLLSSAGSLALPVTPESPTEDQKSVGGAPLGFQKHGQSVGDRRGSGS